MRSHLSRLTIGMSSGINNFKYSTLSVTGECTTIYPFQKSLIWDENNFDETYWSKKEDETLKMSLCIWDESRFDDSLWTFI